MSFEGKQAQLENELYDKLACDQDESGHTSDESSDDAEWAALSGVGVLIVFLLLLL